MPGYLSPVLPVGLMEAVVVGVLAVLAYRWRRRPQLTIALLAVYALTRSGLGLLRPALGGYPTRDQVLSLVAAALLTLLAVRTRPDQRRAAG